MHRHNKVIRIFVSSTFEDMKAERNYLQQGAFHRLREYCRDKEWQFQAVDLRWGISEEATIDQKTMEICLREIERCQEQSPRPNFVVLLGERYGWRPLPDKILQSVAEQMTPDMSSNEAQLFKEWYELDENQLPEPIWLLKARHGRFWDYKTFEEGVQIPLADFFTKWSALHLPDPDMPGNIDNPLALQRLKMERSATEQEIQAGAFRVEDAPEHVFAYIRSLPKEAYVYPAYHDLDQAPINKLRHNLRACLPENNVLPRISKTIGWDKTALKPTEAHLAELDSEVEFFLKKSIDLEMERFKQADENELEEEAHATFAAARSFGISGRERDIEEICRYATSKSNKPYVVWGASGMGKSALLAKAAVSVKETISKVLLITRFISATGKSSTGYGLISNICSQICKFYGGISKDIPDDPSQLEYAFVQYLSMATMERPLVIIVDALDQLSQYDPYRQLRWLPNELPSNVKIIVSVTPTECMETLRLRSASPEFTQLTPLTETDGRNALSAWLKSKGRTLQNSQFEHIISSFVAADCSPLYLHLAYEQACRWTSYDKEAELASTVSDIIFQLFSDLSKPSAHGAILVEKVLTSLRCSKRGLHDDEVLGLLAEDDEFWDSLVSKSRHSLEDMSKEHNRTRKIPPVLWIRLYHDLEFYLASITVPGGEVVNFYHRQVGEAVDKFYLQSSEYAQYRHMELADYFSGQPWLFTESPPLQANARKCDELPWQRIKSRVWDSVVETLCDLDFVQAKATAKLTYDLVEDINIALSAIPDNADNVNRERERNARLRRYAKDLIAYAKGDITEISVPDSTITTRPAKTSTGSSININNTARLNKLLDFKNFLGKEADNLHRYAHLVPHFSYQQGWNFTNGGAVSFYAERFVKTKKERLLLQAVLLRPTFTRNPHALQILRGHSSMVNSVSITPNAEIAISGSNDQTCILWDTIRGQAIKILTGHSNIVSSVCISADGARAISGSADKTCIVWDLISGLPITKLLGHFGKVNSVGFSPDGSMAISVSSDGSCIVWDVEGGQILHILQGHKDEAIAVSITPNGKIAIAGYKDNACIVWDLVTGQALKTLQGLASAAISVCITPDGSKAIIGLQDKNILLWYLESGRAIKMPSGHLTAVNSVSITADGRMAISGSNDNDCNIWGIDNTKFIKKLKGHTTCVTSVCITHDATRAISGSWDKTCIIWDLINGKDTETHSETLGWVTSICIAFNGKNAISGSSDGICQIWDLVTCRLIQTLDSSGSWINSVSLTPDVKWAISGDNDGQCVLWDIETGSPLKTLDRHTSKVLSVYVSPDGELALSGSNDKTCILWDLSTGYALKTFIGHKDKVNSVCISPDGKFALSASHDESCIVWDIANGKELRKLIAHEYGVNFINISPDGRKAVTCSNDSTVKIWDLVCGELIFTFHGHSDTVETACFSQDGNRIISGSSDRSCCVWNLKSGNILAVYTDSGDVLALSCTTNKIIGGGYSEAIFILSATRSVLCPGRAIVTLRKIWDIGSHTRQPVTGTCIFCGHVFRPERNLLSLINTIHTKYDLKPEDSPCLKLPSEAWDEPGLLGNCPQCGESLQFNPFIAEGLTLIQDQSEHKSDANTEVDTSEAKSSTQQATLESLQEIAENSIRKGYWEAAITCLQNMLDMGDTSSEVKENLIISLIRAHPNLSEKATLEIEELLKDLEESGMSVKTKELREMFNAKLHPQGSDKKKPWWKKK